MEIKLRYWNKGWGAVQHKGQPTSLSLFFTISSIRGQHSSHFCVCEHLILKSNLRWIQCSHLIYLISNKGAVDSARNWMGVHEPLSFWPRLLPFERELRPTLTPPISARGLSYLNGFNRLFNKPRKCMNSRWPNRREQQGQKTCSNCTTLLYTTLRVHLGGRKQRFWIGHIECEGHHWRRGRIS